MFSVSNTATNSEFELPQAEFVPTDIGLNRASILIIPDKKERME